MNIATHAGWTKEKPELNQECLLLTASLIKSSHAQHGYYWSYNLFEITQIPSDEGWYWGALQDSEEWGDIADINADLYTVLPLSNSAPNDERTASQQVPDQGDAAGLQTFLSAELAKFQKLYSEAYMKGNEYLAEVEHLREQNLALLKRGNDYAEEVVELRAWKESALACTPDWQAIGRALNLKLGTSVSDQVLPAILKLLREKHELVIALRRLQCYCKGYVRAYETSTRYREVETLLDQHHHSTEVNP